MGNMRRRLKNKFEFSKQYKIITIPKSQDVFRNICRVKHSGHNKKIIIVLVSKL